MPDYSQGKIYKLTSSQTDKIYVGSTATPLNQRFSAHKSNFKTSNQPCKANELMCYDDCKIELIEEYPCDTHIQLFEREQFFMIELGSINYNMPVFDEEKKKIRDKRWYDNHAEEQRERQAEYRERNPDKVKESYKNWRENNLESEANRQAIYFAKNKEALKIKHKERNVKVKCEYCEKELGKYQLPRHLKTCKLIPK